MSFIQYITLYCSLCLTVGVQKNGRPSNCVCQGNINLVYDSLFSAMNDYTLDSRGDVGAWLVVFVLIVHNFSTQLLNIIYTKETSQMFVDMIFSSHWHFILYNISITDIFTYFWELMQYLNCIIQIICSIFIMFLVIMPCVLVIQGSRSQYDRSPWYHIYVGHHRCIAVIK